MQIRTINEAHKEIVARDPKTAVAKSFVRSLVTSGVVPSIRTGNRRLVDVDVLEMYIKNATSTEAKQYDKE